MATTATTVKNSAHRTDMVWTRTAGSCVHQGQRFGSEYLNVFTWQTIRKSLGMTGHDWHLFAADGALIARYTSLTVAKHAA